MCLLLACSVDMYAQQYLSASVLGKKIKQIEELIQKDKNEEALILINQTIASTNPKDYNNLAELFYNKGILTESTTATDSACIAVYDIALDNAQKASNIALQIKIQSAIYFMSNTHTEKEIAQKKEIFNFISHINDTTHNDYFKSLALITLSRIKKWNGNDGAGIQDILEAYTLQKKIIVDKTISSADIGGTLAVICRIFGDMQQTEKQLFYIKELRNFTEDNMVLLSTYYFYYGKNRNQALMQDEAILYADSLAILCSQSKNSEIWNYRLDLNMAISQAYSKQKNGKIAVQYAEDAAKVFKEWGYSYYAAQLDYTRGLAFFTNKEYDKAIEHLDKGAKAGLELNYTDMYLRSLKLLSNSYAILGQWQKAYTIGDSLDRTKDAYNDKKTTALFAKAGEQFQNKEKQQQINTQKTALFFAHRQRIWLTAGLVLSAIIVVLLVAFYRNKKRTADKLSKLNRELEEANQTKARLFGILSHDLRSPISQVYQYLHMLQSHKDTVSEEQKGKIQNATSSLLETMEDLLIWSKTQMNQFTSNIRPTHINELVDESLQLLQLNIQTKNISTQNTLSSNTTVNTDPDFLQTILRNLLQNAIKSSPQNGTINISFENNQLRIQNRGGCFSQQDYESQINTQDARQYLSGLGLRLVDELSKKINASVRFENPDADTTIVVVSF